MSLKWVDVQEIAIQLAEAHPDVDPLTVNFVKLRNLVMALPDFDDIPDRGGEGPRSHSGFVDRRG
jgi:FeS assembly protein IscX